MSKSKRVMQANKRAAFVLDCTVEEYFRFAVLPTLSPRGIVRVYRWGGWW